MGAPAARSVLLTLLGEYVLPAAGHVWQETLIGALETLDHKTPAARRALARSVAAGWLSTERHGRRSRVHLSPATAGSVADVVSFHAEIGDVGDPLKVVAEAWDLDRVSEAYRDFIARFGRLRPGSRQAMFRAQTQLVHEWRRFPFLDPDLPADMLPARWPRKRAHDLFGERHAQWHHAAQEHFAALEAAGSAARNVA